MKINTNFYFPISLSHLYSQVDLTKKSIPREVCDNASF